MGKADEPAETKKVYRVEGFSCANCARTFENHVKQLPGVKDAAVNFGASKITVYGQTTIEELEAAGAFERLKVTEEYPERGAEKAQNASKDRTESFYKKNNELIYSVLFLVFGLFSQLVNGEDNIVTIGLYASSIAVGGLRLFLTGFRNLLRLNFDMRTLMTAAIIGAAIIGEWLEGAVVVILFAVSEALEQYSMERARRSIRTLMEIAPKEALIRRSGQEMTVRVDEIAIGDIMIVKPGQKVAMDGIVIRGRSAVNQAAITGESVPAAKSEGDEVFAGTLNGEGLLEVKVTKLAEDTAIAKIIHLVEEAQAERAPAQAFVDKFAKIYTPIMILLAVLAAVAPPLLFGADWVRWIYQGLSILVVGCPCALVISTPVSIVTAIGNAARHGVLFKGGIYLEEMGNLKAIAFDKTGTLTKGAPAVTDFYLFRDHPGEQERWLSYIAALENRSQHPLAAAILRKAEQERIGFSNVEVEDFASVTGKGIQGKINGTEYFAGSPGWLREIAGSVPAGGEEQIQQLEREGKTVIVLGTRSEMLAVLAAADEVRESCPQVIRELHRLGIRKTIMLTGDNRRTAEAIARQAGVLAVQAELMPDGKLELVKQLRAKFGTAAMVGDGVNDAPALAAASVGIAMGGAGTDTALETADVVLMGDDLRKLPFAIRLSRKALAVIKQNIAFALAVKLIALLLALPGWLTLWIAVASDMGATLLVTLNGLRLLRLKESNPFSGSEEKLGALN